MAFKELKNDLMKADADIRSYLELSEEYIELKIFKILMRFVTTSIKSILITLGVLFVLFFLSVGISFAIGDNLNSNYLGFIIVAGFYLVISLLIYLFRKRLNKPILAKFSSHYFERI